MARSAGSRSGHTGCLLRASLGHLPCAGDLGADPVDRARGSDVEAPEVGVPPAEVRGVLGHAYHAEAGGAGREDVDATGAAAVQVALAVELHAVGRALALPLRLGPDARIGKRAVGLHVEHTDVLAVGVVDEEPLLVG